MIELSSLPRLEEFEVSFGTGGISIYPMGKIESAQQGYAYQNTRNDLCGDNEGDWRREWVVIGHETSMGDPIFIDTCHNSYPVYTAHHGEDAWGTELISNSYTGFRQILVLLKEVSLNREHPVGLRKNPMTWSEYNQFLEKAKAIGKLEDPFFWALMVADEEEGIEPEI